MSAPLLICGLVLLALYGVAVLLTTTCTKWYLKRRRRQLFDRTARAQGFVKVGPNEYRLPQSGEGGRS